MPETLYAKTVDGVHVAYQAWGDGRLDLVVLRDSSSPVDVIWMEPGDREGRPRQEHREQT